MSTMKYLSMKTPRNFIEFTHDYRSKYKLWASRQVALPICDSIFVLIKCRRLRHGEVLVSIGGYIQGLMMKRLLILFTTIFVLTLLFTTIHAQGGIDTVATDNLRLRAGPGTEWRTITVVPAGTPIRLDGKAPVGDYWFRGITPDGQVGWVSIEFITLTPEQIASLPGVWVDTPFTLPPPGAGQPPAQPPAGDPVAPTATPVPPPAAPVANTAPLRGFSYGAHVADWGTYASDLMRSSGMTWVKRQLRYSAGQDPSTAAGWINDAHARGFRILLGVVGDPRQLYNPGYFEQYASFVGGVAALGAD